MQRAYAIFHRPPEFELYDLESDAHEFDNLAERAEHRDRRDHLFAELQAWQRRIADPLAEEAMRQEFMTEQAERRDGSHRKPGFVWPYLERFRSWRNRR